MGACSGLGTDWVLAARAPACVVGSSRTLPVGVDDRMAILPDGAVVVARDIPGRGRAALRVPRRGPLSHRRCSHRRANDRGARRRLRAPVKLRRSSGSTTPAARRASMSRRWLPEPKGNKAFAPAKVATDEPLSPRAPVTARLPDGSWAVAWTASTGGLSTLRVSPDRRGRSARPSVRSRIERAHRRPPVRLDREGHRFLVVRERRARPHRRGHVCSPSSSMSPREPISATIRPLAFTSFHRRRRP